MQNYADTSSFPWAYTLPFHPQLPYPNCPPSTHSCSDRFWVLPPPPCGQVSSSLYFLELQLHKKSARTASASTQTTSSTAAQLQPADSAGSGSFQHQNTQEETAEILAAQRWLQTCMQVQRWGNRMLQPNNSDVSVLKNTRLWKTRRGGMRKARMGSQIHTAFPKSTFFFMACMLWGRQGRQDSTGLSQGGKRL